MESNQPEKLNSEQLLEYIKKQKLKIKKLQSENETLLKFKNDSNQVNITDYKIDSIDDDSTYWALVSTKSQFQKQVAKQAVDNFINKLIKILSKSKFNVQATFSLWKTNTTKLKLSQLNSSLELSERNISTLEQK